MKTNEGDNFEGMGRLPMTPEEGIKAQEGIEIAQEKLTLAERMTQIKEELSKRTYIREDGFEDTFNGPTLAETIKADLQKYIKENLTRPSKYVKGAVISGIVAAGVFADMDLNGPVQEFINMIGNSESGEGAKVYMDYLPRVAEAGTLLGASVLAIRNSYKAISQTIKTKLATNLAFQRTLGMLAVGIQQGTAENIIKTEVDGEGTDVVDGLNAEQIIQSRQILTEAGIPDINREQYK